MAYRHGHFQEALEGYSRAYVLDPRPPMLFDIAQCYRNLGSPTEAASYYRQYLGAYAPDRPPNDAVVRGLLAEMEATAADGGSGTPAPLLPVAPAAGSLTPISAPPLVTTLAPTELAPVSSPAVEVRRHDSVLKTWWFWAGVGVAAAAVTATVYAVSPPQPRSPTLGTDSLR